MGFDEYILAQVAAGMYAFISLSTGNRYREGTAAVPPFTESDVNMNLGYATRIRKSRCAY